MIYLLILLLSYFLNIFALETCTLSKDSGDVKNQEALLERLKPLIKLNKTYETKISHGENNESSYLYKLKICSSLDRKFPSSGAIQYCLDQKHQNVSLGLFNETQLTGGDSWIFLTYRGGDNYGDHCNKSERMANIMIICDPELSSPKMRFLEERTKKEETNCYYLFELSTSLICPPPPPPKENPKGLSTGSILCILVFVGIGLYLFLGILYRRLVVGAKDLEQIPNYDFWVKFGHLQADGCDYICRCGRRRESGFYHGIDEDLGHADSGGEPDDQLLNM